MHFNGFVTFDLTATTVLGNARCPSDSRFDNDFVAPYWLKYTQGTVHAYLLENDRTNDKNQILKDLREAGLLNGGVATRTSVIVITWLRMRSSSDGVQMGEV